MKVVNTNKLNLLWTYGILPIKRAVENVKLKLANNLLTTEEGFGLDARQGPVIQGQIDEIREDVSKINGNLTNSEWVEVPYKDVITLKSPAAFSSAAYWANYCCKNINTVQLDLYIEISSNINGAAFGQIAEGYRPLHRIYIDSGSMSAFIDTGGRISGYVEAGSYKVHTMYAI